jgi:hypothetical protein
LREPVDDYRGYKIVSFAPPSSGGVHLVQMLNILGIGSEIPDDTRLHVIAEAMKLAFVTGRIGCDPISLIRVVLSKNMPPCWRTKSILRVRPKCHRMRPAEVGRRCVWDGRAIASLSSTGRGLVRVSVQTATNGKTSRLGQHSLFARPLPAHP